MTAGIAAMNLYAGPASLNVRDLMEARGLGLERFDNLMMAEKTVHLHFEDPVTYAVNAATPIVGSLTSADRDRVECVITATESGLDFSKSLSTYTGEMLGLSRNCRRFEIKQACYAGTAGLRMALSYVEANAARKPLVLVISTDLVRPVPRLHIENPSGTAGMAYAEPSSGAGAIAMLVSAEPEVLAIDSEKFGLYSFEVADTCRPVPDEEVGNSDLSLLTYLDCLAGSWTDFARKFPGADLADFDYLAFHTPFGGLVKGAHRSLTRKLKPSTPSEIQADFDSRVAPSLIYCRRVGNIMSGSVFLALMGILDEGRIETSVRIGIFSYGSGCSSEFYCGRADAASKKLMAERRTRQHLDERHVMSVQEYNVLQSLYSRSGFGMRDAAIDRAPFEHIYRSHFEGRGLLILDRIEGYRRIYQRV